MELLWCICSFAVPTPVKVTHSIFISEAITNAGKSVAAVQTTMKQ
jgi:hypothetical protein